LKKNLIPCIFALGLALSPAWAQNKPPSPKPAGASDISSQARAAFQALSEADRKAVQEALGWLGFYNGVVDGAPGKRTFDALATYQQSLGGNADGIVTQANVSALKEAAAKSKAAVGFKLVDDAATGIRIGAPLRLLDKRDSGTGAASLMSKDGTVGLYLKETTGDLAALFKQLSADAGPRKVTYKYMKPDAFFVTTGEEGDNKFYRRYAVEGGKLRGFAFLYPKARAKGLDPIALAIANSFDPFPKGALPPVAAPSPTPSSEGPKLAATALIVAPGVAVTALDPGICKAPIIGGKPVKFLEGMGPLARLGGEFGANATPVPVGEPAAELIALSVGGPKATLAVSMAQSVAGSQKVIAALGAAASGAPLFDRQGRLVAFVAGGGPGPRRGGVALAAPHATIPASALGEAVAAGGEDMSAPAIAKLRRGAVVAVFCGRAAVATRGFEMERDEEPPE
jgi:hypothetical protein